MALPSPSSMFGGTSSPSPFNPIRKRGGMDYTGKFKTGPANFQPGRGISVGEIMAQRENRPGGWDADGKPLAAGSQFYSPGWNTSGVGPGTRGYTGSWRPGGYNYGEGTRRPSARNSSEYYAQRDEMTGNPLDNLELGNSNLMGAFFRNALAEARGTGQVGPAAQNEADVWRKAQSFPEGAAQSAPAPVSQEPTAADIQQMIADARRQQTQEELAAMQMMRSLPSPGSGQTTPGATIEGMPADLYFQYKANDQGQGNRFATDPYAGGDTTEAWQYSSRLAPFLKRLGIGQPFPSRTPR